MKEGQPSYLDKMNSLFTLASRGHGDSWAELIKMGMSAEEITQIAGSIAQQEHRGITTPDTIHCKDWEDYLKTSNKIGTTKGIVLHGKKE